ncbi:hypothetical protein GOP47_0026912 [Adiantum capillus-veneris]|nr:hypothetical protein GOP47_0026912 [Adiantum capillus-veneris]
MDIILLLCVAMHFLSKSTGIIDVFQRVEVANVSVDPGVVGGINDGDLDADEFKSQVLNNQTQVGALGYGVKFANNVTFPALHPQGLSMARIDYAPKGLNPPHTHPNVTELLFLAQGSLLVGFIEPINNTLYQQNLYAGELFVFPRGVVHFQLNVDRDHPATAICAFNSEYPSMSQVSGTTLSFDPLN